MTFKKGDTVRLKSGGPLMTIVDLGEYSAIENGAKCMWFDGNHRQEGVFDVAALEPSDNR